MIADFHVSKRVACTPVSSRSSDCRRVPICYISNLCSVRQRVLPPCQLFSTASIRRPFPYHPSMQGLCLPDVVGKAAFPERQLRVR